MFESLTTGDWIQLAVLIVAIVGPIGFWMFKMERHASSTATSMKSMAKEIAADQAENKEAHVIIHRRIDTTNGKVDAHGEKLSRHEVHIGNLLNGH